MMQFGSDSVKCKLDVLTPRRAILRAGNDGYEFLKVRETRLGALGEGGWLNLQLSTFARPGQALPDLEAYGSKGAVDSSHSIGCMPKHDLQHHE